MRQDDSFDMEVLEAVLSIDVVTRSAMSSAKVQRADIAKVLATERRKVEEALNHLKRRGLRNAADDAVAFAVVFGDSLHVGLPQALARQSHSAELTDRWVLKVTPEG